MENQSCSLAATNGQLRVRPCFRKRAKEQCQVFLASKPFFVSDRREIPFLHHSPRLKNLYSGLADWPTEGLGRHFSPLVSSAGGSESPPKGHLWTAAPAGKEFNKPETRSESRSLTTASVASQFGLI